MMERVRGKAMWMVPVMMKVYELVRKWVRKWVPVTMKEAKEILMRRTDF